MLYIKWQSFVGLNFRKDNDAENEAKIVGGAPRISYAELPDLYKSKNLVQQYTFPQYWNLIPDSPSFAKPIIQMEQLIERLGYENPTNYSKFLYNNSENIHIGQRKLLISEIQALNAIFDKYTDHGLIIYAGSAPSMKLWYLMKLYPNVKFLMIDPNEFFIYDSKYGIPHYVRQYPEYVDEGNKWGIRRTHDERFADKDEFIYLSYSDSNMYEAAYCKQKPILWYNTETGEMEKHSKPFTDSGNGVSKKHITKKGGEFNLFNRANQDSINYAFTSTANRVFFVEEYFTDEIAKMIGKAIAKHPSVKTAFWSDIRTNMYSRNYPTDTDILLNTAWMYSWIRIMKPTYSMIKFRTAYMDDKEVRWDDFAEAFESAAKLGYDIRAEISSGKMMRFFPGIRNIQAWCGNSSTEVRLIVSHEDIIGNVLREYDSKEHEELLYHYNRVLRTCVMHENPNADPIIGFDHCNDCAIENKVLEDYKSKNPEFSISAAFREITLLLKVEVLDRTGKCGHGHLFPDVSISDLQKKLIND
jgi:hypothetical protein